MSKIEDAGIGKPRRLLITRPNRLGIGLDVGWRVPVGAATPDADGNVPLMDLWFGNTRDVFALIRLIADAQARGVVFDLSDETDALVVGATEARR